MKLHDIQALLEQSHGIDGFRIASTKRDSYELFFVHRQLETVRATDTDTVSVTVYVRHDGKVGDSTFSVYGSLSEADVADRIAVATERAKLVYNEPFELTPGGTLHAELPSNLRENEPYDMAARIADAVFAADCVNGGSINATEIFLYRDTVRIINSRGVDKTQVGYRAMIEAIPTFTEGTDSVELYEAYRFTEFDPARVTAEISKKMQEVSMRHRAKKPATPLTANVVLREKEIAELLGLLADDLDYASVYTQSNLHKKGDILQEDASACDPLTLTRCGQVRGCGRSAFFDSDGTPLTDTILIRNGIVSAYSGTHRFATYLGEPETGDLPCLKLEPGSLSSKELDAEPWIECVSMSGLQVDLYSDYIGGEIRLAYLHQGSDILPLTDISMSAKLTDVLKSLRLSDTITVEDNYEGPDKLLLHGVTIL